MKIYYSNISSIKSMKFPKIGVLISYYGISKLDIPTYCDSLFLDSGAFSAWRKNIEIDVNEYIKFIRKENKKINIYASLDDITSYKKSIKNYEIMKKQKLNPLPCFHIGEPFWVIEKYLETTNYIALGGIARTHSSKRTPWLDIIFNKYNNIQFHGFGITDKKLIERYPWHSIDSASAHIEGRFGWIQTPFGALKLNGKDSSLTKWKTKNKCLELEKWLNEIGLNFSINELSEETTEAIEKRVLVNILYWEKLKSPNKYIQKIKPLF